MSGHQPAKHVGRVDLDGCYLQVYAHPESGHRAVRVRAGAFWADLDLDPGQAAELARALTVEVDP